MRHAVVNVAQLRQNLARLRRAVAEGVNYRHSVPISLAAPQARILPKICETTHTGEAGKAAQCRRARFGMSPMGQVLDQLSQGAAVKRIGAAQSGAGMTSFTASPMS